MPTALLSRLCALGAACAVLVPFNPASANTSWQLHAARTFKAAYVAQAPVSRDRLPDGGMATAKSGDIVKAWYVAPTKRYAHGVLGDAIEAGGLVVTDAQGNRYERILDSAHVFEDITPRIADLDGDGRNEVIAIRASLTKGASLVVYGLTHSGLTEIASTRPIGIPNRWLNVAGIADYEGKGDKLIAIVTTPHIGGTLSFHRLRNGALETVGSMRGFSNHIIGDRNLDMAATRDVNGDGVVDLVVPSASRNALRMVGFDDGFLTEYDQVALPGRVVSHIAARGRAQSLTFTVRLDNGQTIDVNRGEVEQR